jgi:hypothetical protein
LQGARFSVTFTHKSVLSTGAFMEICPWNRKTSLKWTVPANTDNGKLGFRAGLLQKP